MMVTASHNPKDYNGFKMVRKMPYLLSRSEGIADLRTIVQTDAYCHPWSPRLTSPHRLI
jgi:phosphomannomutase